jgi:hypothetical protein
MKTTSSTAFGRCDSAVVPFGNLQLFISYGYLFARREMLHRLYSDIISAVVLWLLTLDLSSYTYQDESLRLIEINVDGLRAHGM